MPRSIWNGVISFGMVSIPVKLYAATESKDISFNQLHKDCGARLRQLRWCPAHERAVEWDEVVRGYEYAKGEYVVVTEEDFAKLPLPSKQTVELTAFVRSQEIDPIFYERTYYLEPEAKGAKPFALLLRALREKGLTGLAKIALRNKEQLCALRPMDGALVLETLYYPDEIREAPALPEVDVSEKELAMAFTLIDLLSEEFDPSKYRDQYRDALMELIQTKLEGQEVREAAAPPAAKVMDIMTALRASVEAAKKKRQQQAKPRRAPAERRTRAAAG